MAIVEGDVEALGRLESSLAGLGYRTLPFASGMAFLAAAERDEIGCVVLDLRIQDIDGRELLRELRSRGGQQPIIVVTDAPDIDQIIDAVRLGVIDVLRTPVDLDQLAARVAKAIEQDVGRQSRLRTRSADEDRLAVLTRREREVMELVAKGLISKEIASCLGISVKTVAVHRSHIVQKLGTHSVAQVVGLLGTSAPISDPQMPSRPASASEGSG